MFKQTSIGKCFDVVDTQENDLAYNLTINGGTDEAPKFFTIDTGSTKELFTNSFCHTMDYEYQNTSSVEKYGAHAGSASGT